MARLLALEWDGREARLAIARTGGRNVCVEQAFAVDLVPRDPGETFADTSIGQRVSEALSARGIQRVETLVAVGRASIELRVLNVPPVPEEELPDLVRFQAMRQFTTLGDDWPLDFVVLDRNDEGLSVLAATISPDLVRQIHETCKAGGLKPSRLVLRPFAAASLLRRQGMDGRCRLMVDLLADEADLTVLVDQHVVFMRTVRLPAAQNDEHSHRALIGEIRRTLVAAQNQLGGRRAEQIVLCGDEQDHSQLKAQLEEQLSLPVELLNPLDAVELDPPLRSRPPEHPGRFAPLLGMLADEGAGTAHTIDFLHPRKKPKPPSRMGRNSILGAAAACVALILFGLVWLQLSAIERQIDQFNTEFNRLLESEKAADQSTARVAEIDQWVEGDVNWLDELRELSEELSGESLTADDVIVTQMSANSLQSGGRMTLIGGVQNSKTISEIEKAIRDRRHEVRGRGGQPTENIKRYQRQFTEIITITPFFEETPQPPPPDSSATTPAGPRAISPQPGRTQP